MAKNYNITITNGTGQGNISNGTYTVASNTVGYQNTTVNPKELNVIEGTDTYELTISAEGTLTLHVTETGETSGTAVQGAKFIRCDSEGNTYGNEITTDTNGNAVFQNVPYDASNAPLIYFKQTSSDEIHEFDPTLKNTTLETSTKTLEISNILPTLRTIKLNDANYSGLPIASGTITLS